MGRLTLPLLAVAFAAALVATRDPRPRTPRRAPVADAVLLEAPAVNEPPPAEVEEAGDAPRPEARRAPGGDVRIEFTDDAGAGVPGVVAHLLFARRGSSSYPHYQGLVERESDSRGVIELDAPRRAEWYDVTCRPPPSFVPPAWRQRVGRGVARFRLARAATVEGVVVRADGSPVHGCSVRAVWPGAPFFDTHVRTDASGRFRVPVPVAAPPVTLVVQARGRPILPPYLPPAHEGPRGDASLADVRVPGATPARTERILLPRAIDVELAVHPAPGTVRVYDRDGARVRTLYCRESKLELRRLAPGPCRIEFHPGDEALAPASADVVLPADAPVVFRSERGATLEGVLLAKDTEGFRVTWMGRCNLFRVDHHYSGKGQVGPWAPVEDGRFSLRGLGAKPAALFVHRDGDPRCAWIDDVAPDTQALAVRLAKGLSIRGVVRGYDPELRRRVRAVRGPIRVEGAIRDDGSFAIAGLPRGRFRVELRTRSWRPELRAVATDVPAGASGVVLEPRSP